VLSWKITGLFQNFRYFSKFTVAVRTGTIVAVRTRTIVAVCAVRTGTLRTLVES